MSHWWWQEGHLANVPTKVLPTLSGTSEPSNNKANDVKFGRNPG